MNEKTRVKLFLNRVSMERIEKEVNEFISKDYKVIHDIKFCYQDDENILSFSVMVIYT